MSINKVLAFKRKVKRMIDAPRESITINNLLLFTEVSERECPTITGKRGKMHGASTVNTPATKDIIRSVI
jgi:hypothetical protein